MDKKRSTSLRNFGKNLTATVSVAFVLLILGIVGALAFATRNVTDTIKENIGFNVILAEDIAPAQVDALRTQFEADPAVRCFDYLSADDILRQEEASIGADIVDLLGVNPYQAEFDIKVTAPYASEDSISSLISKIERLDGVSEVAVRTEMISDINRNIRRITLVLVAVALALLVISLVLINNTVRLSIYSRRFLIHTMRLVGATNGFIRRPIVLRSIFNGLFAAAIAIGLLALIRYYLEQFAGDTGLVLTVPDIAIICGGLVVAGVLICSVAAIFATNKYLRQDYDEMF